jgi:hypothetical protein
MLGGGVFAVRFLQDTRQRFFFVVHFCKDVLCSALLNRAHDKSFFYNFCKIQKNFQTNLKKFRKLPQIKKCSLFLIETSFEDKTHFESNVAYKYNHIVNNSMKLHQRCFDL